MLKENKSISKCKTCQK